MINPYDDSPLAEDKQAIYVWRWRRIVENPSAETDFVWWWFEYAGDDRVDGGDSNDHVDGGDGDDHDGSDCSDDMSTMTIVRETTTFIFHVQLICLILDEDGNGNDDGN